MPKKPKNLLGLTQNDHTHNWVVSSTDENERRIYTEYRCTNDGCPNPDRNESIPKPGASPRNRP